MSKDQTYFSEHSLFAIKSKQTGNLITLKGIPWCILIRMNLVQSTKVIENPIHFSIKLKSSQIHSYMVNSH